MNIETFDKSDEETWPDQQKDNDKDKDDDKDKVNDKITPSSSTAATPPNCYHPLNNKNQPWKIFETFY